MRPRCTISDHNNGVLKSGLIYSTVVCAGHLSRYIKQRHKKVCNENVRHTTIHHACALLVLDFKSVIFSENHHLFKLEGSIKGQTKIKYLRRGGD